MRTRRSPRNQDILFAALFRPAPVEVPKMPIKTDAEIEAIPFLSKRTRSLLKRDAARSRYRVAVATALARSPETETTE
jgi:hypothetical protein